LLGAKLQIDTIEGGKFDCEIPKGTQNESEIII